MNIAELEASLKLVLTGDNEALNKLKQFSDSYNTFTERVKTAIEAGERPLLGQRHLSTGTEQLYRNISLTSEKFNEMVSGMQAAGVPLSNLIPLALALKEQLDAANTAIQKSTSDYAHLVSLMSSVPKALNGDSQAELKVLSDAFDIISGNFKAATTSGKQLDQTLTTATQSYDNLRKSAQAAASDQAKIGASGTSGVSSVNTSDLDSSIQAVLRFRGVLRDTQVLVGEFQKNVASAFKVVEENTSTSVKGMTSDLTRYISTLGDTAKKLAEVQAVTAAASAGSSAVGIRYTAATKAAREEAEKAKVAAAARTQAMKDEAAALKASIVLLKAKEAADRVAAEATARVAESEKKTAAAITATGSALNNVVPQIKEGSESNKGFFKSLGEVSTWTQLASGSLATMIYRVQNFSMAAKNATAESSLFVVSFSKMIEWFQLFRNEAIRVEMVLGTVRTMHMALADSAAVGKIAYNDLINTMQKYGLSIENLSKPIARMKIAFKDMNDNLAFNSLVPNMNMKWNEFKEATVRAGEAGTKEFKKLREQLSLLSNQKFTSFLDDFGAISSRMALTSEGIQSIAIGLEQMASKGTVHTEELSRQIGNQLPGAMQVALLAYREMRVESARGLAATGSDTIAVQSAINAARQQTYADFFNAMKKNEVESGAFIQQFLKKYKEVFNIGNEPTNNLQTASSRLTSTYSIMISKMDETIGITASLQQYYTRLADVFTFMGNNAERLRPIVVGVSIALSGVAAISLVNVLSQFNSITNVVTGLSNTVGALRTKLGLLVAVAATVGAVTSFIASDAAAAEFGVDPILEQVRALSAEAKEVGSSFAKMTEVNASMDLLTSKIQETRNAIAGTQLNLAKLEDEKRSSIETNKRMGTSFSDTAFGIAMFAKGYKTVAEYNEELIKLQSTLTKLEEGELTLAQAQAQVNSVMSEGAAIQAGEGVDAANSMADAVAKLSAETQKAAADLQKLKTQGLDKLKFDNEVDETIRRVTDSINKAGEASSLSADDLDKLRVAATKHVSAQRQLNAEMSEAEKLNRGRGEDNGLRGGDLSRYAGIIQQVQASMNSVYGLSTNVSAEMNKQLLDYQDALIATAGKVKTVDEEERRLIDTHKLTAQQLADIKKEVDKYKQSLELQAAGLNLASLTLKPLQAMQQGLESFSAKLSDLLVTGKLNAKSFKEAFSDMALSIAKDIVNMTIRALILKPLLASLGGLTLGGSGGSDGGSLSGGTGLFANGGVFGNGGVVTQPTGFNYGGGNFGVMGEAGPEAVMPLRRGANGALGVQVVGGGGSGGPTYNVTYNVAANTPADFAKSESQLAAMLTRTTSRGRRNS